LGAGELALELSGYRRERGLLWPDYDKRCAEVTFDEMAELVPSVMLHVKGNRLAVQAGGNCGQMPRMLAERFGTVYTFEPDHRNFVALTVNTAELPNVFRYQAALGRSDTDLRGLGDGDGRYPGSNCGALYMDGKAFGWIPTLTVDGLNLPGCDLLALDIEGGEAQAILGASWTIQRYRPVVVIEDKGLGKRLYGEEAGSARALLEGVHGYREVAKIRNDFVMVHAG